MYKQNFVPASKGLIKSAPSSLIPDGAFKETMNVRFGDGFVEKVQGFNVYGNSSSQDISNSIMYIGQYITNQGGSFGVVHTRNGVYCINDGYQVDSMDVGTGTYIGEGVPIWYGSADVTVIQTPHQRLRIVKFYDGTDGDGEPLEVRGNSVYTNITEHTDSFTVYEPYWKMIIFIETTDNDYEHGDILVNGQVYHTYETVNGEWQPNIIDINQDYNVTATPATWIGGEHIYENGSTNFDNVYYIQ